MGGALGGAEIGRRRVKLRLGSVSDDLMQVYGDWYKIESDLAASIHRHGPKSQWTTNNQPEHQKSKNQLSLFPQ